MQRKKVHKKSARHGGTGDVISLGSVLKSTLIATPIALAIGILLILFATAILSTTDDPNKYHTVTGLLLIYLTALLGGTLATRLHRRRTPLFCGITMGFLLLLLLLLLSVILPNSGHEYSTAMQIGLHALLFPATVAGALLGARERRAKGRKRYR